MSAGMGGGVPVNNTTDTWLRGPILILYLNEHGQLDAKYDPEKLTEAALLLIAEVRKVQTGYGNVQEALLAAADEMPIETLHGADKASLWLRQRAHSVDPEGRDLVQAIHDRKTEELSKQPWEEWQRTVLERLFQDLRPAHEALVSAGLIEPPLPADPRERSLYLRRHRNTGPDKPIQEQRRRR